jgi:hypothetical protein
MRKAIFFLSSLLLSSLLFLLSLPAAAGAQDCQPVPVDARSQPLPLKDGVYQAGRTAVFLQWQCSDINQDFFLAILNVDGRSRGIRPGGDIPLGGLRPGLHQVSLAWINADLSRIRLASLTLFRDPYAPSLKLQELQSSGNRPRPVLSASDRDPSSGLALLLYSWDGRNWNSLPYSSSPLLPVPPEGASRVFLRAADTAGNLSNTVSAGLP